MVIISSWWFQPIWKTLVKMGIFPIWKARKDCGKSWVLAAQSFLNDLILALQIPNFLKSWVVLGGFSLDTFTVSTSQYRDHKHDNHHLFCKVEYVHYNYRFFSKYIPFLTLFWKTSVIWVHETHPRKLTCPLKRDYFQPLIFRRYSLVFRAASQPGICEAPKQVHQLRCQSSRCLAQSAECCVVSDDVGTLRTDLDIHQQTSLGFYLMVGLGSNKGTMKWPQSSNWSLSNYHHQPYIQNPNVHEMKAGHHWQRLTLSELRMFAYVSSCSVKASCSSFWHKLLIGVDFSTLHVCEINSGWWFQPPWKILVKMGIFPK